MNRRDFLKTIGVGAGATVVGAEFLPSTMQALAAPAAVRDALATADPTWRALNRLTFGPRPGEVDAVSKLGLRTWIAQQLDYEQIDVTDSEKRLGDFATIDMTAKELLAFKGAQEGDVVRELDHATLLRSTYSPRELYEVMVNFWSEHFSIWHQKEQDKVLKTVDDREVVRKYALGKYRDILGASAKSPAMLIYLDNAKSNKAHPNENYARELMELHTITIGKYTEDDVKEVARCFTGWTIAGLKDPDVGTFKFDPRIHDNGAKKVLGKVIPAGGGIQDGETVLDMLAIHPGTAELIANKLARRFIADTPPDSAVQAGKAAFLKSGGDIKATLIAILEAPEFSDPQPKYKRPYEYMVSLFRALDVNIEKSNPQLLQTLRNMGHLPFDWITPDGYSDYSANWEGNMLSRWNLAINLVAGKVPGVKIDLTALVKGQNVPLEPEAVIKYFARHLYGRDMTQAENQAIMGYLNRAGKVDLTKDAGRRQVQETIGLMFAAPAFQFR
jgi:hypothetical protein